MTMEIKTIIIQSFISTLTIDNHKHLACNSPEACLYHGGDTPQSIWSFTVAIKRLIKADQLWMICLVYVVRRMTGWDS